MGFILFENGLIIVNLRQQQRPNMPMKAILFGVVGALFFTLNDTAFKWFSEDYTIVQIIFMRCLLALIVSAIWVKLQGGLKTLHLKHPWIVLLSLVANVTAWYCFYTGLSMLPLTLTVCIFFLTPVVTSVLAIIVLGEIPSKKQFIALFSGFLGVVIITNPFSSVQSFDSIAIAYILCSVLMWSIMAVVTRALVSVMTIGATLLYNNIAFVIFSSVSLQWAVWKPMDTVSLIGLLLLGILGVTAQACIFKAYRSADTSIAATSEYTALIWATLFGYLIWDERISGTMIIGIAFIIVGGLIIIDLKKVMRIIRGF